MSAAIAAGALVFLVLMSLAAERRLAHRDRLTMNWTLDGRPGWSLPRRRALAFTPALAAVSLGVVLVLAPASHRLVTTGVIGAAFAFGHVLHLVLLMREG